MHTLRYAGEKRDSARRTNRRGDVGVLEAHGVAHQRVEMRRLHKGMAHFAQGVVPLVVSEEENDVWARCRFFALCEGIGSMQLATQKECADQKIFHGQINWRRLILSCPRLGLGGV